MLGEVANRWGLQESRGFTQLDLPVVPLYSFLGEGSPTKIDYREEKTRYPYSNLSTASTGRPSQVPSIGLGKIRKPASTTDSALAAEGELSF